MSDLRFRLEPAPLSYSLRAASAATLLPLLGPAASEAGLVEQVGSLLALKRLRLEALAEQSKPPPRGWDLLRNCRPALSLATPATQFCYRRILCPFCHARWAGEMWQSLERGLYGPSREVRRPSLDLVERSLDCDVPWLELSGWQLGPGLQAVLRQLRQRRSQALKQRPNAGALLILSLVPRDAWWQAQLRELYLVRPDAEWPEELSGQVLRHRQPLRSEACRSLARACRYPEQWMRCEISELQTLLDACQGSPGESAPRLVERYGRLRGNP